MAGKRVEYLVTWNWKDPDMNGSTQRRMVDVVKAPNAERAITNLKNLILEEYAAEKSYILIHEVVMRDGYL